MSNAWPLYVCVGLCDDLIIHIFILGIHKCKTKAIKVSYLKSLVIEPWENGSVVSRVVPISIEVSVLPPIQVI